MDTYEEQHHLIVAHRPQQAEYRDEDEDDAAGENAADDGQIGDDRGGAAVDADADHQEADQLRPRSDANVCGGSVFVIIIAHQAHAARA